MLDKAYLLGAELAIKQADINPDSYLGEARRAVLDAFGVDDDSDDLRNAVVGSAFAYPLVTGQLINSKKAPAVPKQTVSKIDDLYNLVQPGDVILMGSPRPSEIGNIAAIGSGETDLQHGAILTHFGDEHGGHKWDLPRDRGGKPYISHLIHKAGLVNERMLRDDDIRTVRVLRAKDPTRTAEMLRRLGEIGTFTGGDGRNMPWVAARGVKSTLKDHLIPEFIASRIGRDMEDEGVDAIVDGVTRRVFSDPKFAALSFAEKVKKVGAVCTSLIGVTMPTAFKNRRPYDIMSKDILGSDAFDTIVERKATDDEVLNMITEQFRRKRPDLAGSEDALRALAKGRMNREKILQNVLSYGRPLTGLGIAAGTAGLAAIPFRAPNSDLSAGEAALSSGLIAGGLTPYLAPSIDSVVHSTTKKWLDATTDAGLKRRLLHSLQSGGLNLADTLSNLKLPGGLAAAAGTGILAHNLIKDKESGIKPLF